MHIAIIGCGQLARMMTLEGWNLGFTFSFLAEPNEGTRCVKGLGKIVERTEALSGEQLYKALGEPDVVTVEREHVDTVLLETLTPYCNVAPNTAAIKVCQHRGREKRFLNNLGISTAPFHLADSEESLRNAIQALNLPVIIKTCGEGYDGKGQWKINTIDQFDDQLAEISQHNDLIVEKVVSFEKEASIVAARSANGDCNFYPVSENLHEHGILITSIVPADLPANLSESAKQISSKILKELHYVGVLSIEFFVVDNQLLVNEMAPRVHNSGHWTQASGTCSQFENHIRSIAGMNTGSTTPLCCAGMVNLLGLKVDNLDLIESNMQVHDYNKSVKAKRKMGHINVWHSDRKQLASQLITLKKAVYSED